MAREYRNITGQTVSVLDASGVLRTVRPDGILAVSDDDERDYPVTGTGEGLPVWAEVTKAAKATTKKENG